MLRPIMKSKAKVAALIGRFRHDQRGQIAIIFGFSITMLMVGVGAGIDLSRAYVARQKLSQAAELTCQYSVRPSVVDIASSTYSGTGGLPAYLTVVNTFASNALSSQNWGSTPVSDKSNGTSYFTATAATGVSTSTTGTAPTNPTVEMQANVATTFMQILKVPQIAVHTKISCLTASTTPLINYVQAPGSGTNYILNEGFETTCNGYCFTSPSGASGTSATPTSATPASPSYTGSTGQPWYIIGYCLETDITGVINGTSPQGSQTAELDCDNGKGNAGNSSITAKVYLAPGSYELRYNYRARVDYPNYDPVYICGSTAADVAWANDTSGGSLRTNQINVYLDMATTTTIPLHTTIDGTQQLGGSNLIDMCVYSPTWIERSVKMYITTPAYYWMSFAADGANDSFGGQLDNIRLCQQICTTALQDNFPPSWLAANNSGVNKVLFEDSFESPIKTQDTTNPHQINTSSNLGSSYGTTVSQVCSNGTSTSPPGWPCQQQVGWATAPVNETTYVVQGGAQGQQYIELDGCANSCSDGNRLISRAFILDPGYYSASYDYMSMANFNSGFGTVCLYKPTGNAVGPYASFYSGASTGSVRFNPSQPISTVGSSNLVGLFMSNGQLVSTPISSTSQGATTNYANPNGTVTSTPSIAPDAVNYYNVSATAPNPVLDVCGYVDSWVWVPRTVNIKITKPGIYWMTFSSNGSASDGVGGAIDDVKLTALGSPFMIGPPSAALTSIPVPAPQPDTTYYGLGSAFNGFTIIADPFMPPSAN